MIKFIDISWIADKALDVYCSNVCSGVKTDAPTKRRQNSNSVSSSIKKIFNSVFDTTVEEYSKTYDKVLIVVPCFPITRMNKIRIMSRFICSNSEYLSEIGVSSTQFQEAFEKFISLKCKNEYITKVTDKVFILNGRGILLKEWKNAAIDAFGSSLINFNKDSIFENNPDFIINFEYGEGKFVPIIEEEKFKIKMIMNSLTT